MKKIFVFLAVLSFVFASLYFVRPGDNGGSKDQVNGRKGVDWDRGGALTGTELNNLQELGFRKFSLSDTEARFQLWGLDGEPVSLQNYSDSWVVLKFWSASCPACRQELPLLQKFCDKIKPGRLQLLAVNLVDDPETVRQIKSEQGFTYKFLVTRSQETARQIAGSYPVRVFPSTVLVAPGGEPVMHKYGFSPWSKEDFLERFRTVFD